jgi:DNA-binding transcriptional LysR family regulator
MELYQLQMFVAVAELGSLTHAAERLHISQPAASAQIKLLEEEFGLTLFERKKSGLALTQAGVQLLPHIQHALEAAKQVAANAKNLSGRVTGPLKFAIIGTFIDKSLLHLEELLNLILKRQPGLDVELRHRASRDIIAGIANGEFDAGICMGTKELPEITRVLLSKLPYRIIAPRDWTHIRKATWKELAASSWISVPKGGSHHQMMMQMFKRLPHQPNKLIEADGEHNVASSVAAGAGLGLMQEHLALKMQEDGNIIVVEKGRPFAYLQFIYRSGRESDPIIRVVSDVLCELWPEAKQMSLSQVSQAHDARFPIDRRRRACPGERSSSHQIPVSPIEN